MTANGYTRLHTLTLQAPADMLESAAGLTTGRVREELAYAFRSTDRNDADALRWLACLCERRVADLELAAADA